MFKYFSRFFKMNLQMINKSGLAATKPLINIKNLEVDKPYIIVNAKLSKTKYGDSVLLELEEAACFLPRRVTAAFKEQLDKFKENKYGLVFKGVEPTKGYPDSAKFEIITL